MKISTTRLETFSDGVIAIIITIMVLAIKLPDLDQDDTSAELRRYLRQSLPYFISYAFSFMMIGIFWTNHHHMFHLLERTDNILLWQNLLFLFWISLVPVSTAMVGANPRLSESAALYGFIMLMTTLSFSVMRAHTLKYNLVHRDENRKLDVQIKRVTLRGTTKAYAGTIAYLVSIPLAFWKVYLAYFCFIIPPVLFFIPDGIDDEKLADRITEKNG